MSRCPQSKMFAVGLYPVCDSDRLNRVSRGWGKEDLALSFQIRGRPLPTHGNCPNPTFPLLQKLIGTPKLWNRDPTFCEIGTPSSQNRDPEQRVSIGKKLKFANSVNVWSITSQHICIITVQEITQTNQVSSMLYTGRLNWHFSREWSQNTENRDPET